MPLIVDILNSDDLKRLKAFSELEHPSTFRYFKNRVFEAAVKNHVYTLLYQIDGKDVGYAHLDFEGRHYIGLCVLPEYQGLGIGSTLLKIILKLSTTDVYLTVDNSNTIAISLYKKHGFEYIEDGSRVMKYTQPYVLPVSIGEGLDKLSILSIKLDKISSPSKKSECLKEYNSIFPKLEEHYNECKYLYNCIRYVNLRIWDIQDTVRGTNNGQALTDILDLNDMRFRIKKRINDLSVSTLNEQKGYAEKVGLFVTHLGLGDLINMNGAIRYCATMVDKLFVVSKKRNAINIRDMFADDKRIEIFECNDDDSDVGYIIAAGTIHGHTITNRFLSGCWNGQRDYSDLPNCFYKNMKIPTDIKNIFFKCDRTGQLSLPDQPYIFTHNSSSFKTEVNLVSNWCINTTLTLDPNKNYYSSGHKFYTIAESYVNKRIFAYLDLIENAEEVHVTDSSFYCISSFLELKAIKKVCYDRTTGKVAEQYKFN
jgi:GNAT superfamily N-acetyltransferase